MTWQVHGYGTAPDAVEPTARALDFEAHAFGPDPFRRLDPRRLYLVRPDGFVAAAVPASEAVESLRAVLAESSGD